VVIFHNSINQSVNQNVDLYGAPTTKCAEAAATSRHTEKAMTKCEI